MHRLACCLVSVLLLTSATSSWADDVDEAREEFWQGNDAYLAGDYPSAVAHFEAAYRLAPNARIQEYLGRTFVAMQRYPEALAAFRRAAEDEPELADEIGVTIEGLLNDMRVAGTDGARRAVRDALARARGEQPNPDVQLRTGLGTTMTDVPVQVLSTPRGAEVYVDGFELGAVGVTPVEIPLFTGPHVIEVRKPHYVSQSRLVTVSVPRRGEAIPSVSFELERSAVESLVTVTPMMARVTFVSEAGERTDLGTGGFEGTLPAGPGTFVVQHAGRDRRVDAVVEEPTPGERFEIALTLDDPAITGGRVLIAIGTVRIVTQVDGGNVLVDGRSLGTGPGEFEAQLTPGVHTLRVELDGHVPFEQVIEVAADAESTIYVNALERARGRR